MNPGAQATKPAPASTAARRHLAALKPWRRASNPPGYIYI